MPTLASPVSRLLPLLLFLYAAPAFSCPFCDEGKGDNPLHREIEGKEVAALVRPVEDVPEYAEMLRARRFGFKDLSFEVDTVLRGPERFESRDRFETKALGFFRRDTSYLMTSVRSDLTRPKFRALSEASVGFLKEYGKLPVDSEAHSGRRIERLAFFLPYLDSPDDTVAAAARSEFARAPYQEVRQLKPYLEVDDIVRRIDTPEANSPSYGLQFLFLGISGSAEHLALFEGWLKPPMSFSGNDLDGLMSGYLMISGAPGLPRLMGIVDESPDDRKMELSFSVMKALRFHSANETVLQDADFVNAYRRILVNPHVAYWAIGELGRLSDWSALPLVWTAYNALMEDTLELQHRSMLLRSVRTYLETCPEPIAREYLASLPTRATEPATP